MPRRAIVIVAAVMALALGLSGALWWRWYTSPRYSLHQMVLALQARNFDEFFKYLDLKEIANNLAQSSTQDLELAPEKGTDEVTRFGRQFGRKFARHLLPKLFEAFEQQIRQLAEAYLRDLDTKQLLALAAAVSVAKIQVQGEEALVTSMDPRTKELLRFQMRREPETRVWRVAEVNYVDFKKFVKRELEK